MKKSIVIAFFLYSMNYLQAQISITDAEKLTPAAVMPNKASQESTSVQVMSSSTNDPAQMMNIPDITMYPNISGMIKHAIFLEAKPDEKLYKIEICTSKNTSVDNCNKHFLMGEFEAKTLEGWGYTYYVFQSNGSIVSTKMGCGNQVNSFKDIASSKTEISRYTSAVPIIVYAPMGIEVKYKLWKQEPQEYEAKAY